MSQPFPAPFSHLDAVGSTHAGVVRTRNEDAFLILPECGVFCVADGIGGAWGGHHASSTTVDVLGSAFSSEWDRLSAASMEDRKRAVRGAIDRAGESIRSQAREKGAGQSGTTAITLLFCPQDRTKATVMHAGDSRAYRFRGGRLTRLTRDHTLANQIGMDEGSPEASSYRNVVTRAVGLADRVVLEEADVEVRGGDLFLLCSDGLTNMVDDEGIEAYLDMMRDQPMKEVARGLVEAANESGGHDNITVLLVDVEGGRDSDSWGARFRSWLARS
ncbi:MAG TPA: protein phosphatase 2C domain-containing protein [Kiritimatiellia bacterium]|mgnify:CR=1 FL=1|nr:protein phosphatase 2C domain-containing protein [Kiritimatiellia bacterium]